MEGPSFASPREVVVAVRRGDDLAACVVVGTVRPPTVGEAVGVLSGGEALRSAVRAWLPRRMAADLSPLSDEALAAVATNALARFTPPIGGGTSTPSAGDPLATVIEGAAGMGIAPDDALATSWPAFVYALAGWSDRRNRATVDAAVAARMAQADKKGWRAFLAGAAKADAPEAPDVDARRQVAYVEAQLAALRETGSAALPPDWEPPGRPAARPSTAPPPPVDAGRPRGRETSTPPDRRSTPSGDSDDDHAAAPPSSRPLAREGRD